MEPTKRKRLLAMVLVMYLLAALFSVYLMVLKRDSLQFHTRDYNYFIEQAARLTDPGLTKRFALNIEGYNMLGLQGVEGVKNLYHAIHAEYFRYFYVLLFGVFRSVIPIYLFYALFFFLPIPYYAALASSRSGSAWKPVLLFTLAYILLPTSFDAVTADLRPRVLYASAWCLALLAVYFDRPFFEKLVAFSLLPFVREEGILLAAVVIALNFLWMQGKPGRWRHTIALLAVDIAAFVAFLAFMDWGGYQRVDVNFSPLSLLGRFLARYWLPVGLAGIVLLVLVGFTWLKKRQHTNHILLFLAYCGGMALAGVRIVELGIVRYSELSQSGNINPWQFYLAIVADENGLIYYVLLLLFILLWDFSGGVRRKLLASALVGLVIVFAITTLLYLPTQVSEWRQNIEPARLVWDFTRAHGRYQTKVLVDYDTYQAFYNYEHVFVYNRLPLWLATPKTRYYPDNQKLLLRLMQQRLEYAVISQTSLRDVLELAELAGVNAIEIVSNDRYIVLKLER